MNREHKLVQLILRSWPFPRGAGRLADRYFSALRFSDERATVQTSDGFQITVNPNELIGRHLYLMGEFDRSIVELLCNFAEPNDVLLDIGANIGYVSACFLHNTPNASVIAVEPQVAVLELLHMNLPPDRSSILPYAVSDRDGEATFQANPGNTGAGRIVEDDRPGTIRVQVKSASSLLAGVGQVDLVKIDAEGHERVIIEACLPHFHKLQPRAILFEDAAHDATEIAEKLEEIGYITYGIQKSITSLALVSSLDRHDCIAISKRRHIPGRAKTLYGL